MGRIFRDIEYGAGRARLAPAMASLRLQVLAFVRRYIEQWRESPSYGEISSAMGVGRTSVRNAVKSLAADGLLLRTPGPRGLALPGQREEALRLLRELGWTIDPGIECASAPAASVSRANLALMQPPLIDYPSRRTRGRDGETRGSAGHEQQQHDSGHPGGGDTPA